MGSAGKALMRAEMPGPSSKSPQARMQHTAWVLFFLYTALNALLTVILRFEGLTGFDALCHAFGTMATGGFSTYNDSVGHFATVPGLSGPLIETTIIIFMIAAGTNFMLLYFLMLRQPGRLLSDVEWRTYIGVIVIVTLAVLGFGMYHHDFDIVRSVPSGPVAQGGREGDVELVSGDIVPPDVEAGEKRSLIRRSGDALRYSLFQVVSIMTTTGYGTHDFDRWNGFTRGVLFLLMFVGGCAGSTGGGLKVIRHVLFLKILGLEVEHSFHPTVVRPLRLGGNPVEDQELRKNILVYFGLILVIFVFSWMLLVTIEPDSTWKSNRIEHKLIDSASGIAATLNNIGPGLGTVGATQNYSHFSWPSKLLFTWLMMLGRLEVFVILVLFLPRFWRSQ
jgi:trk system potassium uptake protein TrkH